MFSKRCTNIIFLIFGLFILMLLFYLKKPFYLYLHFTTAMKIKYWEIFLFSVWIIILNFIVHYGFHSSYNNLVFQQGIPDQYYTSVYAYRFFSRELFEFFFHSVQQFIKLLPVSLDYINSKGSVFYHSIFLFNVFFQLLTVFVVNKIINNAHFYQLSELESKIILFSVSFFIIITQYIVTFYDASAYFFLLLSVYYIQDYLICKNLKTLLSLCLIVLVSTANRETAALSLSFLLILLVKDRSLKYIQNNWISILKDIGIPTMLFLLTYFSVRLFLKYNNASNGISVNEDVYLKQNFTQLNNILGILFSFITMYFIISFSKSNKNKIVIKRFLFFSLPYILMVFFVGILWEIRLFVPLFILSILLSQMKDYDLK